MAATFEAKATGAGEVLLVTTDGYILQGPSSGIVVHRDGTLLTKPLKGSGILPSITMGVIPAATDHSGA